MADTTEGQETAGKDDCKDIVTTTLLRSMAVPYDPELADRLRDALAGEPDITERKMFGGLAFLRRGHMAVVANRAGGLMVRTDPATEAETVSTTPAKPVEMQVRPMKGWLVLEAGDVADDQELDRWVERALSFVSTLPAKR